MTDPDLDAKLKAQTQFPNLRGVRHQCCIGTAIRCASPIRRRTSATRRQFRRGFALLEKYGLHFELQVFAGQAKYAVELIKAFPNVPMILLHSGMLTDRAPLMIEQWRAALTAMAAFPNVHVKLSGLGMFNQGITVPQARQVIRDCIQIFGIDRTIYGSNFPLEKLHASYADFFARLSQGHVGIHRGRAAQGVPRQCGEVLSALMLVPPAPTTSLKSRPPCRADRIRRHARSSPWRFRRRAAAAGSRRRPRRRFPARRPSSGLLRRSGRPRR